MSDRRAFLETITADPAADAPRLVYADWLDGIGDVTPNDELNPERAEFIRVQVELANLHAIAGHRLANRCKCDSCVRAVRLRKHERDMLVNFPAATYWLGPADPFRETHPGRDIVADKPAIRCFGAGVEPVELEFRRGFVEEITISWGLWLAYSRSLLESTPLQKVAFTYLPRLRVSGDDVSGYTATLLFHRGHGPSRQEAIFAACESLWKKWRLKFAISNLPAMAPLIRTGQLRRSLP